MGGVNIIRPETSQQTQQYNKYMSPLVLVTIGIALVLVPLIALVISGIVYVGIKKPNQRATLQVQVCGRGDVQQYNSAMGYDSDAGADKAQKTLADLAKSIKAREMNELDPTCQYILWHYAASVEDKKLQQEYLKKLTELSSQGSYVSSEIRSLDGIETLQVLTEEQAVTEEKGQG